MGKVVSLQQYKIEKAYIEFYSKPLNLSLDIIPKSELAYFNKKQRLIKMKEMTKRIEKLG